LTFFLLASWPVTLVVLIFALKDEKFASFWTITSAIQKFYQKHRQLPVSGYIPDMKAQSSVYIELQGIYKVKAHQDATEVLEIVQTLPGGGSICLPEVELYCKNAAFVKAIAPSPINVQKLREVVGRSRPKL
jgi:amyloid beta precursor protein binding protein 1